MSTAQYLEQLRAESLRFKQLLGPFAESIIVKAKYGRFAVPIEDMEIGRNLRLTGIGTNEHMYVLEKVCKPESRVLVVGAHIGTLAIPLAKASHSVVAIEPNPSIYDLLKLNLFLNEVTNCRTICIAASDKTETFSFLQSTVNSGGSKRKPVEDWLYYSDQPTAIDVEAVALDELLHDQSFDIVIMDIEGSEQRALQGMQRILQNVGVLQVEFLPHHLKLAAKISAKDFLDPIRPHFDWMRMSSGRLFGKNQFDGVLTEMLERDQEDSALIFSKQKPQ